MEQIVALTVVAELPHDLEIQDTGVFAFKEGDPWRGWSWESMSGLAGFTGKEIEGRVPTFRLNFRRVKVRSRLPLYAADRAFAHWVIPLLDRRQRARRRIGLALARAVGMKEMVTVVGITAFIPLRLIPAPAPPPPWVEAQIGKALDVLNEFLIALGVQARDSRVGPITRADLPAVVPLIAEEQPVPSEKRVGINWMVPLHPWRPNPGGAPRDPEVLMEAATLFRAATEGTTAWFPVLELGHLARRDGLAGRYAASIVSAATSIEILLSTVVREAGPLRGWDERKISGALESGFRNVATSHVPKLLRVAVDIDDPSTVWGRWWKDGYLVRNKVVHEGHKPTDSEAHDAAYSAMDLVAEVGRIIEADATFGGLGFGLPTGVAEE